jgi:GNAT superfamily N-acetyltransferase
MSGTVDRSGVIDVRPIDVDEAGLVAEALRDEADVHARCIRAQAHGRGLYLVAWLDERPVGVTWIGWKDELPPAMKLPFGPLPLLVGLRVDPAFRRRGVGRKLVAAAEAEARGRGLTRIGAVVADDNPAARAFYEALGFEDAGLEPRLEAGTWTDRYGRRRSQSMWCRLFVKRLAATSARP